MPWRVAFGGFAPGFAYLVGGDPRLRVPRRDGPPAFRPGRVGRPRGRVLRRLPARLARGLAAHRHDAMPCSGTSSRDPPALLDPGDGRCGSSTSGARLVTRALRGARDRAARPRRGRGPTRVRGCRGGPVGGGRPRRHTGSEPGSSGHGEGRAALEVLLGGLVGSGPRPGDRRPHRGAGSGESSTGGPVGHATLVDVPDRLGAHAGDAGHGPAHLPHRPRRHRRGPGARVEVHGHALGARAGSGARR